MDTICAPWWKDRTSQAYARYLKQRDWEWMATLTFPVGPRFGPDRVKTLRLGWTRDLCITERMQIGYFYVLGQNEGFTHLHLLMVGRGKTQQGERTLSEVPRRRWEALWPFYSKIEVPESNVRVADYVAGHIWKCDQVEIDFYNLKLLKRLEVTSAPLDLS